MLNLERFRLFVAHTFLEGTKMEAAFGIMSLIYLGMIVFWIWTLIDVLKSEFQGSGKIVWLLVVFFLAILGSILYVAIGRKQRIIKEQTI